MNWDKKQQTAKKSTSSDDNNLDNNDNNNSSGWDVDFDIEEEVKSNNNNNNNNNNGKGVKGELKMLLLNGEKMKEPYLQDHGVMTEDMISEQQEIYAQLGTSEEAQKIRAKMQASTLLSDMQAFKAANPNCVLHDFVRWHSPRDWIVDDNATSDLQGHLSARMQLPGNLWLQIWDEADSIPSFKQRSLFDYTTHAEKSLHFLESISLHDLLQKYVLFILFLNLK